MSSSVPHCVRNSLCASRQGLYAIRSGQVRRICRQNHIVLFFRDIYHLPMLMHWENLSQEASWFLSLTTLDKLLRTLLHNMYILFSPVKETLTQQLYVSPYRSLVKRKLNPASILTYPAHEYSVLQGQFVSKQNVPKYFETLNYLHNNVYSSLIAELFPNIHCIWWCWNNRTIKEIIKEVSRNT